MFRPLVLSGSPQSYKLQELLFCVIIIIITFKVNLWAFSGSCCGNGITYNARNGECQIVYQFIRRHITEFMSLDKQNHRFISSTNFNAQFSLFINNMSVTLLSSTCFEH